MTCVPCSPKPEGKRVARSGVLLAIALGSALLAACGTGGSDWKTTHVAGKFPDLQFTLTGESGEMLTASDLQDQVVLVFFGYTYCPDVCPVTMARLRGALQQLDADEREKVTVLFVSVDPGRDSAKRLKAYTSGFGPRFLGATSEDMDTLRDVTARYASAFSHGEPDEQGNYLVSHSSNVFVFDGQGRAQLLVRPDDGQAAIVHDLRLLL